MSALVTCGCCSKNLQESKALPSMTYENVWYCKDCVDRELKKAYGGIADNLSINNSLFPRTEDE